MSEYTEEELKELEELEELEKLQESDSEELEKEDTVSSKEEVEEVEIINEEESKKDEETEEEITVKTDEIIEDNTDKEIEISEIEEENKTVSDTSYDKLKKRAVSYMIIYGILPRNFKYTVWDSELTQKYIQLQYAVGCKVYKESPEAHHDIFKYDKMIISKK